MKRFFLTLLMLPAANIAFGDNHVISYGQDLNANTNAMSVKIGDTITWNGDFNSFPLISASVPDGAVEFNVTEGETYSYIVTVAGNYFYRGNSNKLTGRFSAEDYTPMMVVTSYASSLYIAQQEGRNIIYSVLENNDTKYTVSLFDMSGKLVYSTTNATFNKGEGFTLPNMNATGIYMVHVIDSKEQLFATKIWNN